MRIGIYSNVLAHKRSGIGWHVTRLLENLAAIDSKNEYFLFYRTPLFGKRMEHFRPDAANFHDAAVATPDFCYYRYSRIFDRWFMPRALEKLKIDVFHGPNHYLPARKRIPQIVTYHDLAEAKLRLSTPERQQRAQVGVRRCLSRADHVIALSECTKRDVLDFDFSASKVDVIYEGGNFDGPRMPPDDVVARTRAKFSIDRPYILFVGSLVPRKNLSFLVRAFARMASRRSDPPLLVLAGATDDKGECERLATLIASLGIEPLVRRTGYLSNEDVQGLYGGARLFALPSLYEGFGMVALEAMTYKVPVVAARAGSLPEVIGDAGILVEPDDDDALAEALAKVLSEEPLRDRLIELGLERFGRFSWRTCAEETLALYARVVDRCRIQGGR